MKRKHKRLLFSLVIIGLILIISSFFVLQVIKPDIDPKITCEGFHGLCIEMEVNTYSDEFGNNKKEFSYPSFRQGDYLRIDQINIYNVGENISLFRIYTNISPEKGNIYPYNKNYGEQQIIIKSNLTQGDIYVIKRSKYGNYEHFINSNKLKEDTLYDIELYKPEEWIFEAKPEGTFNGYTLLQNGRWIGDIFTVYSRTEMDSLISNRTSLKLAAISLVLIIIITLNQTYKHEFEGFCWSVFLKLKKFFEDMWKIAKP